MKFLLRKPPRSRRLWAVLAAVGSLAAVGWLGWSLARPRYLEHELETASDEQVPKIVQQLRSAGSGGIRGLVVALGSSRSIVASEARHALRAELDHWELLDSRQASPKLLALAEALAGMVGKLDDDGRNASAEIALRILLWPLEDGAVDRARLVAACDSVLRAKATAVALEESAGGDGQRVPIATLLEQPHLSGARALPPGGLPLPPLPSEIAVYEGDELNGVQQIPTVVEPAKPVMPVTAVAPDDAIEEPAKAQVENFSGVEGFELFSRWHQADPVARAAIDEELHRRGYKLRQIEIARHLTAPDDEERRHWAEALPGLSGFEAKPWLMRLSHDEVPEVRLTAVTLMATSSDPEMLRRVAEVARNDPDERVASQAARAIEIQKQ